MYAGGGIFGSGEDGIASVVEEGFSLVWEELLSG